MPDDRAAMPTGGDTEWPVQDTVGTTSRTEVHSQFARHEIYSPVSRDPHPRRLHDAYHRLVAGMDVDVLHHHLLLVFAAVATVSRWRLVTGESTRSRTPVGVDTLHERFRAPAGVCVETFVPAGVRSRVVP
jgi:hypothetical protein